MVTGRSHRSNKLEMNAISPRPRALIHLDEATPLPAALVERGARHLLCRAGSF